MEETKVFYRWPPRYMLAPRHAHEMGDVLKVPATRRFGDDFPEVTVMVLGRTVDGMADAYDIAYLDSDDCPDWLKERREEWSHAG